MQGLVGDRIAGFKAYDVRGRVPDELNEGVAYRIGRAYATFVEPAVVAVGRDIRRSSSTIAAALVRGLNDSGVDVQDIGLCGTEQIYFATFHGELSGGIMVTASHNPPDYNGFKFVREDARPISGDTGLEEIHKLAEANHFPDAPRKGTQVEVDIEGAYIEHLLSYIDLPAVKPLKIVTNAGNGCAGRIIDLLEPKLPFEFVKLQHEPDGTFPNGIPNPLLPENREPTIEAVRSEGSDLGIAWDGDFDRCFLFDENGGFVEGYYIVGLLAQTLLASHPGESIVHDPRLVWNTVEVAEALGGRPVQSKAGHAFMKDALRQENAIYGGEMSGHHFFRDFAFCDSGMIPWLLVTQIICEEGRSLSALVEERQARYPASGEINRRVSNAQEVLQALEAEYGGKALSLDVTDGLSVQLEDWRFNVRASNTEPLLRINVESRGDNDLMKAGTEAVLALVDRFAGD